MGLRASGAPLFAAQTVSSKRYPMHVLDRTQQTILDEKSGVRGYDAIPRPCLHIAKKPPDKASLTYNAIKCRSTETQNW